MSRSDLFLIYEANEPVRWGCFEFKDSGKIEFLTCTNPLEDKWEVAPWPETKRINAMNRNRTMTAFYLQENNIYQIPLVQHSGQKNIAQVLELKTFVNEVFWSPVMLHANKFIQNNTLNTIEHWIEQYPSVKTDLVFPEMKQESPYSAQNLFEKLQVQELSLVQKPGETLLDEGHMEIWFYRKNLCYRVNILGQEKSGKFRTDIQDLIKKGMELESLLKNKEFQALDDEGQIRQISNSLQKSFPSLRLKLSVAYLNLNSNTQNMILASVSPSWLLLDIEQEGPDVIDEVCRALVFDDTLDIQKIHSMDIFKNVQQFTTFALRLCSLKH